MRNGIEKLGAHEFVKMLAPTNCESRNRPVVSFSVLAGGMASLVPLLRAGEANGLLGNGMNFVLRRMEALQGGARRFSPSCVVGLPAVGADDLGRRNRPTVLDGSERLEFIPGPIRHYHEVGFQSEQSEHHPDREREHGGKGEVDGSSYVDESPDRRRCEWLPLPAP